MHILINIILAQGFQLPPGEPWTLGRIMDEVLTPAANFLIAAGVTGAIIALVISGIMYFKAGSDSEAKNAKAWFKNGIIGAFIILAVGVIINTIALVVTGGFFGGIPGSGLGTGGAGVTVGAVGSSCTSDANCSSGSFCNAATKICRRNGGNFRGENCGMDIDCVTGLTCEGGGLFGTRQKACQ